MAAAALYAVTARRVEADEVVRCQDATSLPELTNLLATYAAAFAADPGVRVDVETLDPFPAR